ncbi:hypothetical protein EVAR_18632_1 [Eumeta japonica]|uniref:Uncharacterized protein n=1 Tax=Eumeta variegata TaxID=151549 RepID=A0A4C1U6P1_EUMVA|nr:hypothetical protein EVAR_18632_1 [Eumeta japonica]
MFIGNAIETVRRNVLHEPNVLNVMEMEQGDVRVTTWRPRATRRSAIDRERGARAPARAHPPRLRPDRHPRVLHRI